METRSGINRKRERKLVAKQTILVQLKNVYEQNNVCVCVCMHGMFVSVNVRLVTSATSLKY